MPILAVNAVDQTVSLPPYLLPAISMADYLAKAKPPLSFGTEPPLLKILDFGGCALPFHYFCICYAVPKLTFSAFQQGEARPRIRSAIGIRPPETVFPMIALGDKDAYWDMRSDIWSLACTVSLFGLVVECIDLRV